MSGDAAEVLKRSRRVLDSIPKVQSEGERKASAVLLRSRGLLKADAEAKKRLELLELLPQGHGSGLDADMVDGLHAVEILARAPGKGGGGGGSPSMPTQSSSSECPYDVDKNGVIDNSEKLEGHSLAEVQVLAKGDKGDKGDTGDEGLPGLQGNKGDTGAPGTTLHSELTDVSPDQHHPQAHTLDSHSEKKLDSLAEKTPDAGVTIDACLIKDGKVADSNLLGGKTLAEVTDPAADIRVRNIEGIPTEVGYAAGNEAVPVKTKTGEQLEIKLQDIDVLLRTLLNTPLARLAVDSAGRLRIIIDVAGTATPVTLASTVLAAGTASIGVLGAGGVFPVDQRFELIQRANIEYNECQRSKFTFA